MRVTKYKKDSEGFVQALKDRSEEAIFYLSRYADMRAFDLLVDILSSPKQEEEDIRVLAAQCLGQMGDASAVDALVARLNPKEENSTEVQLEVIWALQTIGSSEPLVALMKALGDVWLPYLVRSQIAYTVGHLGIEDDEVIDSLYAAIGDTGGVELAPAILGAIGMIGGQKALQYFDLALTNYADRETVVNTVQHQLEDMDNSAAREILKKHSFPLYS
jgi:HEAT repeat protein